MKILIPTNFQSVLVWSEDIKLIKEGIKVLKLEFDDSLNIISPEELPSIFLKKNVDFSKEIEKYNFHVIKMFRERVELILINNEKYCFENFESLEFCIEDFARKILAWGHQNPKDDHPH